MRVILSPRAIDDLAEIAAYIAIDDPVRSISFVEELREACHGLDTFPRRFPRFPRLGPTAHQRTVGNYLILYDVTDLVTIVAVVHAARNLDALF